MPATIGAYHNYLIDLLINWQSRWNAEQTAIVKSLEETTSGCVVAECKDPAFVGPIKENPPISALIYKYPIVQTEIK